MSLFSKGRDAQRFEALAEQSEKKVYLTCLRMMRSHEDAQDALQETMLRAYKAFSSVRDWGWTVETLFPMISLISPMPEMASR